VTHTSLVSIAPYRDISGVVREELLIYTVDAEIKREAEGAWSWLRRPQRTHAQQDARRGVITHFSEKSRASLLHTVRNADQFTHEFTLNFGPIPPPDGKVAKNLVDKILRRLRRIGRSYIWKLAFCASGRPHYHVLVDGEMDVAVLAESWAEVVGSPTSTFALRCRPIRDRLAFASYLTRFNDPENRVPDGFTNVGRFWGGGGPNWRPVPLAKATSGAVDMEYLLELAKESCNRKGRFFPDDGVHSRRLKQAGGRHVAAAVLKHISITEPSRADTNSER
jgi:hypothetical protein